jgi:hypothetical protein
MVKISVFGKVNTGTVKRGGFLAKVLVNSYFLFLILKYNKYANHITSMLDKTIPRRLYHAEYVTKPESRGLLHLCNPSRQVRLFSISLSECKFAAFQRFLFAAKASCVNE